MKNLMLLGGLLGLGIGAQALKAFRERAALAKGLAASQAVASNCATFFTSFLA